MLDNILLYFRYIFRYEITIKKITERKLKTALVDMQLTVLILHMTIIAMILILTFYVEDTLS